MTQVLTIDAIHPEPGPLRAAADILQAGGLVAFPTETVYGLGAHALNPTAVARIFAAKGRPAADPLIVHVAEVAQITALVRRMPDAVSVLSHFWPGPLTLVLPKSARVPGEVTAGLDSVAVRIPAHPVARGLLQVSGLPVAAPSANRFTRPSPTCAAHVLEDLAGRLELLLDGGPTWHGVESTVVDLSSERPTLLRPGAVTVEALLEALPDLWVPPPILEAEGKALRSPGTQLKHYSPRAKVLLFHGPSRDRVLEAARQAGLECLAKGQKVGLLLDGAGLATLGDLSIAQHSLGSEGDAAEASLQLFAGLRALDAAGVDVILTMGYPEEGLGRTVLDRLRRAAEGQILWVP